jgi:hypothetical protein
MESEELKVYLETNNKSGYKTREIHIKNNFPDLYNKIIEFSNSNSWHELLYNYINNLFENPKCISCNKILHLKKYNIGYHKYCSINCLNKSEQHKDKIKQTCLNTFGVDNPSKSNEIKKKIKNKLYKNGKWYNQTDECKNKTKQTNLKKYGVDHFSKTKEFHNKRIQTNIRRYGMDSYNKTEKSKNETKKRNLEKYNTEWFLSTNEFKKKSKKTCLIKYGVDHHTKTEEYKNKMKIYYLKKYGVEYATQNKRVSEKIAATMIERYGELWLKHAPKYNPNSIIYLDLLSEKLGIEIQHALNGGEKKFIRYWVDGFIAKYNICIEWDEKHHNAKRQKERDLIKENYLKEMHNCHIIRINEKEFLKNIEENIKLISNQINSIISST